MANASSAQASRRVQEAARLGGHHPPCAAVKQFYAVLTFQPPDMLADGRRGHAQHGSGGVHAAVFEDGGENEQGFDVLHSSFHDEAV